MPQVDIAEFLFPRKLVFHPGSSGRIGELLSDAAVPRGTVMVIADRVVHELGLTAAMLKGLEVAGYSARVAADVAGEPTLEDVEGLARLARDASAVAVIGIGGGSALDSAKLVAYSTVSNMSLSTLHGPVPELADYPTLLLVPTTVGTGAEATRVAMMIVEGAKRIVTCPQFVPDIAVLDPDLIANLPAAVVAATALDALAHAVESMMSTNSNQLSWQFSQQAARTILSRLRDGVAGDPTARADLLHASFLAGVALNAGVVVGHSISYALANRVHVAHGVGCAMALPYCLAYNQGMAAEEADQISRVLLGRDDATLRELADEVVALTRDVGIPQNLGALGISLDDVGALVTDVIENYPRPTNPVPLAHVDLNTLLIHLHAGDLAGAWTALGATR